MLFFLVIPLIFSNFALDMRVILQRCTRAEVRIDNKVVGSIGRGFMVLVGVTDGDTQEDADRIAKKVAQMRVFEDNEGKMNLGLQEVEGAVLSISQFTLYADCRKGNRPSFVHAARPETAEPLYDYFNRVLREQYGLRVETGRFGADMKVDFINDGPVTIILDSSTL
jgi:D-tyrosyl-tRNA(Tyr) deacylase